MATLTVIGAGNMGAAIAAIAVKGGSTVQVLARDAAKVSIPGVTVGAIGDAITGDVVVVALPYPAVDGVLAGYGSALNGKVLVDITNPLDFQTFDSLVVPADSSAAAALQQTYPEAKVVKAFNTNLAATLASGTVGTVPTTVLIAGDDDAAKQSLASVVEAGGLRAVDAGSLKRARELEALGFLQIALAASERTSWTTGFALEK